jgi:hypothetical protein
VLDGGDVVRVGVEFAPRRPDKKMAVTADRRRENASELRATGGA